MSNFVLLLPYLRNAQLCLTTQPPQIMNRTLRLLVAVAFVCVQTEGIAQHWYSGARIEYHHRLDSPTLTYFDPPNVSTAGERVTNKANVGVYEYSTHYLNRDFTFMQEIGYCLHSTTFQFGTAKSTFTQKLLDARLLIGKSTENHIFNLHIGPGFTFVIHDGIFQHEPADKTKFIWLGLTAGGQIRINRAVLSARYNYCFNRGDTQLVRNGSSDYYTFKYRRNYLSLGFAIILKSSDD